MMLRRRGNVFRNVVAALLVKQSVTDSRQTFVGEQWTLPSPPARLPACFGEEENRVKYVGWRGKEWGDGEGRMKRSENEKEK